ncbi:MAG: hypothetical protein SGPRY_002079, partial [Prymnesium sp.]
EREEVRAAAAEAARKAAAADKAASEAAEWLSLSPEEQLARASGAAASSSLNKSTTGIGGAWSASDASKVAKHKPKVSTWGVFDRPADISKAYGGGRRIGVGGYQESPEEKAKKQAELAEKMKAYRKSIGVDSSAEDEHREEIKAAKEEAAQLMRFGDAESAVKQLEEVREWLCVTSELGGNVLLDLGFNYIAAGKTDEANVIFKELVRRSPVKEVKRAAQQCLFQEEAQSFLKVDSASATDEFSKVSRLTTVKGVKRYALADAYLGSPKRQPVSTISEVPPPNALSRLIRHTFAHHVTIGCEKQLPHDGTGSQIHSCNNSPKMQSKQPLPPPRDAHAMPRCVPIHTQFTITTAKYSSLHQALRGEWLLGLTCFGERLDFAPLEACQTLRPSPDLASRGSFERLTRGALAGLIRSEGTFEARSYAGVSGSVLSVRFEPTRSSLGPLPLPTLPATEEDVLLLDDTMCVLRSPNDGFAIWVRPSMQAPPVGDGYDS